MSILNSQLQRAAATFQKKLRLRAEGDGPLAPLLDRVFEPDQDFTGRVVVDKRWRSWCERMLANRIRRGHVPPDETLVGWACRAAGFDYQDAEIRNWWDGLGDGSRAMIVRLARATGTRFFHRALAGHRVTSDIAMLTNEDRRHRE